MATNNAIAHSGFAKAAELCQPVEGVQVSVDGKTVCETDASGQWKITAPPGASVVFSKNGFATKIFKKTHPPPLVRMLENDLIGYQDKLHFLPGETLSAKVHAVDPFQAKLYRYGLEKRLVSYLGDFPACEQHVPDGKFVEDGLGWKNSLEYKIPDDAKPGIYGLNLSDRQNGDFTIPMVVSSKERRARTLVLASTNNWQTYNLWGGRSRYRNFEDESSRDFFDRRRPGLKGFIRQACGRLLPGPIKNLVKFRLLKEEKEPEWQFKRLSIKRPFNNCALRGDSPMAPFTNHLAAGEWRLLAWMEREDIDYDIISGIELHRNPDILKGYKAIILSTHSEYWSGRMFDGVRAAHNNHRLWIINASGNSIFREIEYYDDESLRCRSLRFGNSHADETQLIGVRFSMAGYGTCAPYQAAKPDHWIFNGVDLAADGIFGRRSLNRWTEARSDRYDPGRPGQSSGLAGEGASGWETDKLSATASTDFIRVAKGMNPDGGGADMVVREPSGNRGGVFSASSITFTGSLLIDPVCSGIMRNALDAALR